MAKDEVLKPQQSQQVAASVPPAMAPPLPKRPEPALPTRAEVAAQIMAGLEHLIASGGYAEAASHAVRATDALLAELNK